MKVNEIFYSLQGESSYAGWPCAFIRLAGCNLRCTYCDTQYALFDGTEMSVSEVLLAIEAYPTRLVLVTGGEPMLQASVFGLFKELIGKGYTVLLETGGQVSLAGVAPLVHKIMDFKCPSSGMASHNDYGNVRHLTLNDELKFVVGDRTDFDWACDLIRQYDLASRVKAVHFSPVFGKLSHAELASWVLSCGLPVHLQLQLHKIIWPDMQRGV
ncbi:MAG TPA: radical SAM protein [Acidobacteriota bacterium]|nr:radical SAM protein [Acidobacteriota bacterium]